jgi:hypothetical protein
MVVLAIPANKLAGTISLFLAFAITAGACTKSLGGNEKRIEPVYDKTTGRLQLLKYDSDGDGKIDTVSYMDGALVVRIEIDKDEDGKVDRWEYYGPDQKLEKVGFSRANDGKEDAWSYAGPDGAISRIEVSTRRDGKANRFEHYEKDVLVRAEEDTDGDGTIDKWETYDGARLASVAFDTNHRGTPDRRLIYGTDGSARLEVDPAGDGHFVAADQPRGSKAGASPRP